MKYMSNKRLNGSGFIEYTEFFLNFFYVKYIIPKKEF